MNLPRLLIFVYWIWLTACGFIFSSIATASSESAEVQIAQIRTTSFEQVTITATKTKTTVAEAPASVRVVDEKMIDQRRVTRFGDALREVPGLFLMGSPFGDGTSGSNRATVTIRGIQGSNRALFMLDGLPINNAQTGVVNLSSFVMDDIERIDVVPGPFSALYGSYALSGVINIQSKKPERRELKLRSGGGGGGSRTPDQWNFAGIYRDRFDNGLGIAIGGNLNEVYGFTNSTLIRTNLTPSTNIGNDTLVSGAVPTVDSFARPGFALGKPNPVKTTESNAFVRLYYDFSPKTHVMAGASFFRSNNRSIRPFESFLRDANGNVVSQGNIVIDDGGVLKRMTLSETEFVSVTNFEDITRYFARFDHQFDNRLQVRADFSFQDRKIDTPVIGRTLASNFNGGPGELQALPTDERINGKLELAYPIYLKSLPDWIATHSLIAGFDANQDKMHRVRSSLRNWRDVSSKTGVVFDAKGTNNTYGIYLQNEWIPHEKLSIYMGGRVDFWSSSGSVKQFAPLVPIDVQYGERTFTQFNPKGALVFKPLDNLVLKASVGTAFRPPTTFDLYTTSVANNTFGGTTTRQAAPNLKPEKVFSWEVGAETAFATGTTFSATYFQSRLTDLFFAREIIRGTPNDLTQTENIGHANIHGVEATLRQQLFAGISIFGNVSYAKTEITRNLADPLTIGRELMRAPRLMWNLGLEGNYSGFYGSLIGRFVDKSFNDQRNRDIAKGVSGAWDAYYLFDGKIGYEIYKGLRASFAMLNITNERNYQSALMPGRTFIGELAFNY